VKAPLKASHPRWFVYRPRAYGPPLTTPVVAASMFHVSPTPTQRAYLDFIRRYVDLHKRAPAEHEMQAFFMVTPPTVHQMVVTLTTKGFVTREPGQARSIRLVEALPVADDEDDGLASRPPDEITEPLDPEIAPLIEALRAGRRIVTKGSCWGHGRKPAYVGPSRRGGRGAPRVRRAIEPRGPARQEGGDLRCSPELERGGRDRLRVRHLPRLDHALVEDRGDRPRTFALGRPARDDREELLGSS
jgi:hypothetical protein